MIIDYESESYDHISTANLVLSLFFSHLFDTQIELKPSSEHYPRPDLKEKQLDSGQSGEARCLECPDTLTRDVERAIARIRFASCSLVARRNRKATRVRVRDAETRVFLPHGTVPRGRGSARQAARRRR